MSSPSDGTGYEQPSPAGGTAPVSLRSPEDDVLPPGTTRPRRWRSVGRLAVALTALALVVVVVLNTCSGPEETPPPVEEGPPTGSTVLFEDDFSDDDWCDYHRVQNRFYSDDACDYDNDHYALREDDGSARFEVRPGDAVGGGLGKGERSELSQDSASWEAHEGDRWYVHERLRLGQDFEPSRSWTILTQFHAGKGSPPLSLQVSRDGALVLRSGGKARDANEEAGKDDRVLVPADEFEAMRGEWFEVDLEVLWSRHVDEGGTAAWVDGDLVAPWRSQQTMTSDRCYWKGGIYREPTDSTAVLRLDDLRITAP